MISKIKKLILERRIKRYNPDLTLIKVEKADVIGINNLRIGNGCRIGPGCVFNAKGGLEIGQNVIFAPNVVIWTQNHNYYCAKKLPYDSKIINKKVKIGDNCWIGEGVKIAPGVSVGEGAIIAIGSVLLRDVPPLAVVTGNPGSVVKIRDDKEHYYSLNKDSDSYLRSKLEGETH